MRRLLLVAAVRPPPGVRRGGGDDAGTTPGRARASASTSRSASSRSSRRRSRSSRAPTPSTSSTTGAPCTPWRSRARAGEVETGDLEPGESADLTVDFSEAGEYEMYCPVDGHRGMGMEGSITVGGEGGGDDDRRDDDRGGLGLRLLGAARPRRRAAPLGEPREGSAVPALAGANSRRMSLDGDDAADAGRRRKRNWSASGQPVASQRPFGEKTRSSRWPSTAWRRSLAERRARSGLRPCRRVRRRSTGPRREGGVEHVPARGLHSSTGGGSAVR